MITEPLTVYIVDDDKGFRGNLEGLVRLMGYKVFGFGSAEAFLEQKPIVHPSCLLLDVNLPGLDGITLLRRLREQGESLPVIFITGHGDITKSVTAMKCGAIDYLLKPFASDSLREAIVAAHARDIKNIQEKEQRARILSRVAELTSREQEVMRQIITGRLNKQIADDLGVAEKTIRKHRGQVMRKMQMSSVADLVRILEKVDIIHPAPEVV